MKKSFRLLLLCLLPLPLTGCVAAHQNFAIGHQRIQQQSRRPRRRLGQLFGTLLFGGNAFLEML